MSYKVRMGDDLQADKKVDYSGSKKGDGLSSQLLTRFQGCLHISA
jgi:hypothetical protein